MDVTIVENPQESASERMMARLYFASFWAVLLTGAVRKWLFPGVSVFYLLQDVPMGFAYLCALWTGLYVRGYLLLGILLISVLLTLQGILQVIVSGLSGVVAFIGLHNYLFYLPILVVFPICLIPKYRKSFVWWNLIISIPMCLLVIVQAESPKSAWVNRTTEGEAFGLPGVDVARVTGTFNFTVFYGIWVAIAVAFCLGEWLLPKERRAIQKPWLMIICTFAVNLCYLVSGSRSAIGLALASIIGGFVAALVKGSPRAVAALGAICLLLPIVAAATYVISPVEYDTVMERLTGEKGKADIQNRLEEGLVGWVIEPKFSLLGAGVGMGVDAAHIGNTDTYNFTYALSEADTIRTVMELGTLVGTIYMVTRIALLLGMVILAVSITRSGSSPHVLPLSFCLLAQAYQGDLTRGATMTATQVMIGYAFILSAYYYPDNIPSLELPAGDSLTRSV
jgi:hypothetical protein